MQMPAIMGQSPYDVASDATAASAPRAESDAHVAREWSPSRYNARARDERGHLILWNTLSGAISVFDEAQARQVEPFLQKLGSTGPRLGVAGYLAERGFIVERNDDEGQRMQFAFGKDHYRSDKLELILLASEDCNFRCVYCYEAFARGTMLPHVRRGVLKLAEQRAPGLRQLQVGYFGGEPLYGLKAIEEMAPRFLQLSAEHELQFTSSMTTNGYLLVPETATRLLDWNIRHFQITLDGLGEDHDRNRHGRDGQATFDRVYDNLRSLHERSDDFGVTLRVNFDQTNYPRLPDLLNAIQRDFGSDPRFVLSFSPVGKWGGPNDDSLNTCGAKETRQALVQLQRSTLERGLSVNMGIKDVARPGTQICYAARPYSLIIGADGKVMKCTVALDTNEQNIVGHLAEDGALTIDARRFAFWTEPAFENDAECKSCWLSPGCGGMHCPWHRMLYNVRPCPSLKTNLRNELTNTVLRDSATARRIKVGGIPAAPLPK